MSLTKTSKASIQWKTSQVERKLLENQREYAEKAREAMTLWASDSLEHYIFIYVLLEAARGFLPAFVEERKRPGFYDISSIYLACGDDANIPHLPDDVRAPPFFLSRKTDPCFITGVSSL